MPSPTEEQRRAVLSIDFGASYTKIAWRPRWDDERNAAFNVPSRSLAIDGEFHIPSIAIDRFDEQGLRFGTDATDLTAGPNGKVYRNWKATLFHPAPDAAELDFAKRLTEGFLRWIKEKLNASAAECDLNHSRLRICIPALDESLVGEKHLRDAAIASGWPNAVEIVSEPRANLIGLASSGRNIARNVGNALSLNWDEMFSSLFVQAMRAPGMWITPTAPVRFVVIDIGAFTTDIGVCAIERTGNVKMSEGQQRSFKHGIASLDEQLTEVIKARGIDRKAMTERDFNIHKEPIYQGKSRRIAIGSKSAELESDCVRQQVTHFAEKVVEICREHITGCPWYILTGGGFKIPHICEHVKGALNALGMRLAQDGYLNDSDHFDSRVATALGGASLALDQAELVRSTRAHVTENTYSPSVNECPCGGRNKDCARCHGKGVIEIGSGVPKPVLDGRISVADEFTQASVSDTFIPPESEEVKTPLVLPETPRISRVPKADEPERANRISVDDFNKRWNEVGALAEFTLDGWMGELVFGGKIPKEQQQERLRAHSSPEGKASWLRLLCLATCFGVRVNKKRERIEPFWRGQLTEVWQVFTSESDDNDWSALNKVFLKATHRQFRDLDASGEDADLWRRVFYDFRKLHQFVYRNQFPEVVLELAARPETSAVGLVYFMKSGIHPDGRWAGVLGQSMTAPLLFVMRELRRLDIVDSRFDSACFYMNSPARNEVAPVLRPELMKIKIWRRDVRK